MGIRDSMVPKNTESSPNLCIRPTLLFVEIFSVDFLKICRLQENMGYEITKQATNILRIIIFSYDLAQKIVLNRRNILAKNKTEKNYRK